MSVGLDFRTDFVLIFNVVILHMHWSQGLNLGLGGETDVLWEPSLLTGILHTGGLLGVSSPVMSWALSLALSSWHKYLMAERLKGLGFPLFFWLAA